MSTDRPPYLQALDGARQFWKDWDADPDPESKYRVRNGMDAIVPGLLAEYGLHPLQARWTAEQGRASATETGKLSENGGM